MMNNIYILPFQKTRIPLAYLKNTSLVKDFYSSISAMNKSTAGQYLNRLSVFSVFLNKEFDGLTIDSLVNKIKRKLPIPTVF